ncbi:MAG: hypothetical protein MI723_16510 [Caulobacterales bacterium]|nr:hypothetical protein [Caulobacterales bacterium]
MTHIIGAVAAIIAAGMALADDEDTSPAGKGVPAIDEPSFNFDFPAGDDLEWRLRFSLGGPDEKVGLDWTDDVRADETIEFATGSKWGLTLGFDGDDAPLDLESMRAGAFFNITPRMRIGGELSFSNPEEGLVPGETDGDAPEVKLESAFKF